MDINPAELPWNSVYKLLIGSVIPRPIGWISSLAADGTPNLAPFSFFNVVCANPPTVLFCPMVRGSDGQPKDTLTNVRATGEFVVNIVTEELAAAMNASAVEAPPTLNEFEVAGLATTPSITVRPPRVSLSPIHFECRVHQIVEIGSQPGSGSVVIGQVLHMHFDDRVLAASDKIDPRALKAIGKLAGNLYTRVNDFFEIERPPSRL